jgi:ABC-type glycerol-3-phosphate transport system permease component
MIKKTGTTAVSGCLIWFLLISIIGSCVLPVFFVIGSLSSFSDFAIQTTGGWLCPEESTPESYSYATTSRDENGFERPATAYELHCVDASGEVVKTDPVLYAFIWIGICAALGLIITVILALVFAVPGGVLVTKILGKLKPPGAKAGGVN